MTALDLLGELYAKGVQLTISDSELRIRAPQGVITEDLRQGLAVHKQEIIEALGEGVFPDDTLPDEVFYPAHVPNTVEAIKACLDAQRVRPAA